MEQPDLTSGASDSGNPGATAIRASGQPAPASQTSHKQRTSREKQQDEVPLGIPPAGSTWVASSEFQNLPVVNLTGEDNPPAAQPQDTSTPILTGEDNPPAAQPQDTSTPIKATPVTGRHVSGGKINLSRVNAVPSHLENGRPPGDSPAKGPRPKTRL